MHECSLCGQYCDCDGEDLVGLQPDECIHLGNSEECDYLADVEDGDASADD
jgi:hypothetical protein